MSGDGEVAVALVGVEPEEDLVVDLGAYEGPLHVLLELARREKVDLKAISILALAEQYLVFIAEARRLRLELAADYLVMAAWLAFLKSRLLLPEEPAPREEPDGAEMAARLALRLRRLEAMRLAADRLMARAQLGRDVFARGAPEGVALTRRPVYRARLSDLLRAYAARRLRGSVAPLRIDPPEVYRLEEALERLRRLVGALPAWERLERFLPAAAKGEETGRGALAALFAAGLELVREGRIEMRQEAAFAPIYLRRAAAAAPEAGTEAGGEGAR
jgi:segregation and condensation protein A